MPVRRKKQAGKVMTVMRGKGVATGPHLALSEPISERRLG